MSGKENLSAHFVYFVSASARRANSPIYSVSPLRFSSMPIFLRISEISALEKSRKSRV
ncbi:MAG: hypothetical protein L6V93_18910 [Clostridiales bacterium]|nr:MAG: hypothetical protein L6V93_18910 [Clostridiales bacterium]